MFKFLEKIRESIFGERTAIEISDKIIRNKKLNDNEKLSAILEAYGKYYKFKHDDAVDLMTWELYYEDFMIDGKFKHQLRFDKFYKSCEEEINYAYAVSFMRQINFLKNIDYSKCSASEIAVVKSALGLNDTYDKKFNYEMFYVDKTIRDCVNGKNDSLVDLIIKDYDAKHPALEPVKLKNNDDGRDF